MMIIQGGPREFSALAFGEINPGTLNFLQEQVNLNSISSNLTQAGREFMSRGREIFEQYNGAKALQMTRAAIRAVKHIFQPNAISALNEIGALQQAPPAMQRWIMACPEVRQMYHMHRCDGYSDTYLDAEPGRVGEQHTDYCTVMNGLVQADDEGDYKVVHYYSDSPDDFDPELSAQLDILSTWDAIRSMMGPGKEDPTDPFAGKM